MSITPEDARTQQGEVNLLAYAAVVWRHRWPIVGICAVAVLVTLVMTVTAPKMYEATATLITPKEGGAGGLLGSLAASGLLQQPPGLSLSVPSLTPNRDILVSVLKSRTMARDVMDRFGLQARYRARYAEDAIRALQAATKIGISKEGVISIKVEDTEPRIAADIANFYVKRLDDFVAQLGIGEAGRQRVFFTEQVARAKTDLATGEEALRRFQERNRAIALQDQTRGAIETAARLKGEIVVSEVQLQVMRNFATEANPEMVALRRRIEEMKRQLAQMQYGEEGSTPSRVQTPGRDRSEIAVPAVRIPEVGLELTRLTRDVKIQETVVGLLTQQLEQAKIAEARDLPTVQVLDNAVPAERHSRPKLLMNLEIAMLVSLLIGVLLAFLIEQAGRASRRSKVA